MRQRVVIWTAILFLIVVPFTRAAAPQRGRAESLGVRGKLMAPGAHDADQHIEVRIEKESSQVIQTTYTDGSGSFEFRNLAPGTYYLSVTLDGFQPIHQQVEVMSGFGSTTISLFLAKASPEASHG